MYWEWGAVLGRDYTVQAEVGGWGILGAVLVGLRWEVVVLGGCTGNGGAVLGGKLYWGSHNGLGRLYWEQSWKGGTTGDSMVGGGCSRGSLGGTGRRMAGASPPPQFPTGPSRSIAGK